MWKSDVIFIIFIVLRGQKDSRDLKLRKFFGSENQKLIVKNGSSPK
jgi:hypothetical protein